MGTILNFMSSVFCLVTTILTWNNIKKSRAIINRQMAEIDRVKKERDEWKRLFIKRCRDYELEIQENEKLKAEVERLTKTLDIIAGQIKLEFYREFDEIIPSIMADKIDEIVKERRGDE